MIKNQPPRNVLGLMVCALMLLLAGCGSNGGGSADPQADATDPQKAAAAAQSGAAADAANRQARQADEARRAATKQAP